jgi:hypothetical protein
MVWTQRCETSNDPFPSSGIDHIQQGDDSVDMLPPLAEFGSTRLLGEFKGSLTVPVDTLDQDGLLRLVVVVYPLARSTRSSNTLRLRQAVQVGAAATKNTASTGPQTEIL